MALHQEVRFISESDFVTERKLSDLLKKLKDHDSMLFQANGIHVKHGEKFPYNFNVKHVTRIEAKRLQASRGIETLKEKKMTFEQMFKGLQGKIVSKKRKEKENRRKSNNRKRKPFKNPMRISYLGPKSPRQRASPLLYFPPFLTIPEAYACINVEDIATILFRQVAPLFCCSSFTNIYIFLLVMQQEVGCSPI